MSDALIAVDCDPQPVDDSPIEKRVIVPTLVQPYLTDIAHSQLHLRSSQQTRRVCPATAHELILAFNGKPFLTPDYQSAHEAEQCL